MKFFYNDGGRKNAGYKGSAGDCGARAIAIAFNMNYQKAYDLVACANKNHNGKKSARNGVDKVVYSNILNSLGWVWMPAPKFEGRKAKCSDMPFGVVIARQAGHFVAVVNGIPYDSWDSSEKMVYGYWVKK